MKKPQSRLPSGISVLSLVTAVILGNTLVGTTLLAELKDSGSGSTSGASSSSSKEEEKSTTSGGTSTTHTNTSGTTSGEMKESTSSSATKTTDSVANTESKIDTTDTTSQKSSTTTTTNTQPTQSVTEAKTVADTWLKEWTGDQDDAWQDTWKEEWKTEDTAANWDTKAPTTATTTDKFDPERTEPIPLPTEHKEMTTWFFEGKEQKAVENKVESAIDKVDETFDTLKEIADFPADQRDSLEFIQRDLAKALQDMQSGKAGIGEVRKAAEELRARLETVEKDLAPVLQTLREERPTTVVDRLRSMVEGLGDVQAVLKAEGVLTTDMISIMENITVDFARVEFRCQTIAGTCTDLKSIIDQLEKLRLLIDAESAQNGNLESVRAKLKALE